MSIDRFSQLAHQLELLQEQLAGLEEAKILAPPEDKVRLEQQIRKLRQEIQQVEQEYRGIGTRSNQRFTVPYPRNEFFTGREAILTAIHESIGQTGTAALSQTNAIHGLGGVGKTQTAVEYAYRYFYDQSCYDWVLWVNASNLTLASSFGSIATDLALPNHQENKLDENIAAVRHWLETTDSWLLIFDNVDDPRAVKPFRPNNPKGRILITSRIQRLESLGVGRAIALDNLESTEAHLFLQRRTQTESIDPTEQQALSELAKALGYYPWHWSKPPPTFWQNR